MQKGWESSAQESVYVEGIRHLDDPEVNELRLILDQVDDSIALFNSRHRLVQFNKSFVNHWKLPSTWLQAHPYWDEILAYLITQEQLTELQAKDIQYYLEHAKHQACSFTVLQADGRYLEMQIRTTTESNVLLVIKPKLRGIDLDRFDQSGHYMGALGLPTDIKERKQWEEFLQQANEQLGIQLTAQSTKLQEVLHRLQQEVKKRQQTEDELRVALEKEKELNRLKSHFVSMTSHELGNPLAAVLVASQLLERTNPGERQASSYLRMIQESVEQMRQLIEDVLLIGQAEAEKIQVKPTELNINHFCCRLLGELRLSLGKHYHLQMVNLCSDPTVCLDTKLLRQILSNLLTNAIKYSPRGGTIRLEVMRQEKEVIFHVQDEGIGIPQKDLPHLFGSFNRAGNVGKIPGTGLGLAIVKHYVEVLGGQISVTSQEDKGTTFRVVLPTPIQSLGVHPSCV